MIKRYLTIAFSLLIISNNYAQDFISTEKQWNVLANGWAYSYNTEIFKIAGDSLIENTLYDIIWVSGDSMETWEYQGLLREDSNIVYYTPHGANEGILYNFNLEVGDSAYINNIFCGDEQVPVIVTEIDSVDYNGEFRKRLKLYNMYSGEDTWIEGIGSMAGPLYSFYWHCIICPYWELLCHYDGDTLKFHNYAYESCYVSTVGTNNNSENNIYIQQNPIVLGQPIVVLSNSEIIEINIYNFSGILVFNNNGINGYKSEIQTDKLQPGLYIVKVRNQSPNIQTHKVIIL